MQKSRIDIALVLKAQSGSRSASEALFTQHYAFVHGIVKQYMFSRLDLEDVVQEICMRAHRDLGALRKPERFPAWLTSIALNYCKAETKRRSRNRSISLDTIDPALRETGAHAYPETYMDLTHGFLDLVRMLPIRQRHTVILYYYWGYKVSEIARLMNCSPNAVTTRLFHARKKLAREVLRDGERPTSLRAFHLSASYGRWGSWCSYKVA